MKYFRIATGILFIFLLVSCRESFVKTKDIVPVKGVPEPSKKESDSTKLFRKNPDEREKSKFKRDLDTLKPKLALNLDGIRSPFEKLDVE